jgi:hypothetical protein
MPSVGTFGTRHPARTLPAPATARRALAAATMLGVLADALLRAQPLGLNLAVLVAALLAALAWLARRTDRPLTLGAALLGALALAFGAAVAWRDSPVLVALDVLALWSVLCALAFAVLRGDALAVDRAGPLTYAAAAASTGVHVMLAAPRLAIRAAEDAHAVPATLVGAGTLVRGGLLASPALLVFGILLTAADPTFARALSRLVDWDGGAIAEHVLLVGFTAWCAGGYLYAALLRSTPDLAPVDGTDGTAPVRASFDDRAGAALRRQLRPLGIGVREASVALGLVDLLFLGFGALQVGWLFGGAQALSAAGVTVAEYARRGFFELVAVAALALPLLLLTHATADDDTAAPRDRRAFRLAAGTLVALVLVLLVSAADRMRLYTDAFGLTESRFYASAFMGWLGAVFAWAAASLLRGRAAPFAVGSLVAAWTWVLALHVVNPDARIVDVNAARAEAGRSFDAGYVVGLSADAAPALTGRVLPLLATRGSTADRCAVTVALRHAVRRTDDAGDWRSWRWSRARARRVWEARDPAFDATCTVAARPAATPTRDD